MDEPNNGRQSASGGGSAFSQFSPPVSSSDPAGGDDEAGRSAPTITGQAAATASSVAGQVKDKAAEALGGHKDALADRIDEVAHAVHRSGTQFEGQQDWLAGAIERGAAELGSLADALRTRDVGNLLREVRSFAVRQPALFIGASLAAGFALARFGKVVAADLSASDLPSLPEIHDERR